MPDIAQARMEAVRDRATTTTSVPDDPLFAKVKAWAAKKALEPAG